jgi:hypothetical protein
MPVHPLGVAILLVASGGLAAGATTGDTTTTFTVTGGALSITVPTSTAASGSSTPASTISMRLGAVQVTDARAQPAGQWASSASATDFITGSGTAAETVTTNSMSYWSGIATAESGTATFTPGQTDAAHAQTLDIPRTAYSASSAVGNNSCTWNPWLVIAVPAQAVTGTYTGTVTHSVA